MGHEILWSDLNAMGFDPVEKPSHYRDLSDTRPFDVLKAQEHASASQKLPPDVEFEIAKLRQADRLVFHFPLWWFSLPAILKGWCDRVLANGAMHSADARFDRGLCLGKRALFCVTTGSTEHESSFNGKEGDVLMLLWPLAYTLRYLGFDIIQPRIVHGIHGYQRGRAKSEMLTRMKNEIESHRRTMAKFDTLPTIPFNRDADFDENGRLISNAKSHSSFIRTAR